MHILYIYIATAYGYGVKHRGYRVKRVCRTVCKHVEIHHRRVYYGQFAQVMAAAIQREVEIEEACKTNPSAVKVEDIDLDDNEEAEEEGAYKKPLRGIIYLCTFILLTNFTVIINTQIPSPCSPYTDTARFILDYQALSIYIPATIVIV